MVCFAPRAGRLVCTRGAHLAWSSGPSTSPFGVIMLRSPPSHLILSCLGAMLFCMIDPAGHAEAAGLLKLPKLKTSEPTADFYPPAARRLGIQGRVLVEFTISPRGRVSYPPTVILAEPEGRILQEGALSYVRRLEFDVRSDWEASGGPHHKFRFSFVFLLLPCREGEPCEEPAPYFGADRWFTITAPPADPPAVILIEWWRPDVWQSRAVRLGWGWAA